MQRGIVRKRVSVRRSPRALSACLLRAQDEERRRIARELHDGTGQMLALLTMNLDRLVAAPEKLSPEAQEMLSHCVQLTKKVSSELRTVSYLLHPPLLEEIGLASTLRWYAEGFKSLTNIEVSVQLSPHVTRLPLDIEVAIFRIVQECLTNVHRHSGSPKASISLQRQAGDVVLEIQDEGKGIPQHMLTRIELGSSIGIGLRGIRERVRSFDGRIEMESSRNGTRIKAVIPICCEVLAN